MIVDARALEPGAELRAEICVVGAGAAGIALAAALVRAGRDVCLVESGGVEPDEETQRLYELTSVGYPVRERFMSRARYYGGTCNLWAGRSMRLAEADVAPPDGAPDCTWPLPYRELAAYYPRAAKLLGLPAPEYFELDTYRHALTAAERRLFTLDAVAPAISLWGRKPMRFGAAHRALFRRAPHARLVLHANVIRIALHHDGGAVDALEAATLDGRRLTLRARAYVLACGGLENARLLLASRDVAADGVGNGFDAVGRYFMDHPRAIFGRVRLQPGVKLRLLDGVPLREGKVQLGIGLTPDVRVREGLPNHYATLESEVSRYAEATYESVIRTMKVVLRKGYAGRRVDVGRGRLAHIPGLIYLLTPKELLPHPLYRLLTATRRALLPNSRGRNRVVVYFCEQPPNRESRVTLGPERDRLGVPKLVLRWRLGSEVTAGVLRLQDVLGRRLREAGVGALEPGTGEPVYSDASHHMGTTRMSADPRTGVVDVDCRVHGIANLYIAGSSVFPSAGHANPTLTIVALALRLADRLSTIR